MQQPKHFAKSISAYSMLAAAFLGESQEADAQVIYKDVFPDDTISHFGTLPYDVDNDGTYDFRLNMIESSTVYRLNYMSADGIAFSGFNSVLPLESGDSICSQLTWGAGSWYNMKWLLLVEYSSGVPSYYRGLWEGGLGDRFIGLRMLLADNQMHYGWVRLSLSPLGIELVVKDYAYNAMPEECVVAGEGIPTHVIEALNPDFSIYPNPASSKIFLKGLNKDLREGTVSIIDCFGRKMMTEKIPLQNDELDVSTLANGMYLLELKNEFQTSVKQFEVNR